jgi:hypothetical protein
MKGTWKAHLLGIYGNGLDGILTNIIRADNETA